MARTSGRSDPVCLFGYLMVVIFIGILNYRKRKEDAYKTANTKMMELLSRMPDMATIYDFDLNIVDIVNPDNHNWKDVDTRCQIGKNLKDLHLEYPQAKEMLDEIILHVKRTVETGEVTVFNCKYGKRIGSNIQRHVLYRLRIIRLSALPMT